MAYRKPIEKLCDRCRDRRATHSVLSNRNAHIGDYCDACSIMVHDKLQKQEDAQQAVRKRVSVR